jgi:hypothetical protein
MNESFDAKFARLLRDGNFLGAGMMLKNRTMSEEEEAERAGELAGAIVDELSRLDRRQERERILYLRSVLGWLLRDIPGLSSLYREQLQAAEGGSTGPMADIYRNFKTFSDVAAGRKKFSEGAEEAAENLRRGFEDAAQTFSGGRGNEGFDQFMKAAEEGFRGGFDQFGELFRRFTEGGSSTMRSADPDSGEQTDERPSGADKPPKMEVKSKPVDIETED